MKPMQIDTRPLVAAFCDAVAFVIACFAATLLLDVNGLTAQKVDDLIAILAIAVPLQITVNIFFGVYQGVWRYTSLPDIQRIVFTVLAGTVFVSFALRVLGLDANFGYREYILYPLLLITLMSLSNATPGVRAATPSSISCTTWRGSLTSFFNTTPAGMNVRWTVRRGFSSFGGERVGRGATRGVSESRHWRIRHACQTASSRPLGFLSGYAPSLVARLVSSNNAGRSSIVSRHNPGYRDIIPYLTLLPVGVTSDPRVHPAFCRRRSRRSRL